MNKLFFATAVDGKKPESSKNCAKKVQFGEDVVLGVFW